jgi:glycosyltransferase involved in cell wall biosynthesis
LIGRLHVPFVYGPVPASVPADLHDEEWQSWVRTTDAHAARGRLARAAMRQTGPIAHFLRNRTLQRADAITVEANTQALIGHPNVVVIRPGIDVEQFAPDDRTQPVSGRIIAVGRLIARKGYDVLIRAVARVIRRLPSTHLILVGSGPQEQSLGSLAGQLGIEASVTFTGDASREELISLLHSAEVFCHPAKWESFFPAAPLEAMACGLPMVVSSAGALPELVGNFAGFVHMSGDDEQLAGHLLEVLTNEQLRRGFGTAARDHIVRHFTWAAMCDSYIDLYERLIVEPR